MKSLLKSLFALLLRLSPKGDKGRKNGMPAVPTILATISGFELAALLKPYGIEAKYPTDYVYGLPDRKALLKFLAWYKKNAPIEPKDYSDDALDCDDFAWVKRAYALLWMKGECVFGYVEAGSTDEAYKYPLHAFLFTMDNTRTLYFNDPLGVAAPEHDLYPAYEVDGKDAKF